jgi:hypothetical protein
VLKEVYMAGRLNLFLDDDLHRQLKAHCKEINLSVTGWIRCIIVREMTHEKAMAEARRLAILAEVPAEMERRRIEREADERAEEERRIKWEERKAAPAGEQ